MITVGHKTELCELAEKHGTDKWFYYTAYYHELLNARRATTKKVLEVGIGSPATMLDSLSRVGITEYKTGASLFMWEEYFPNADIYGLDIDRSILFSKGRIHTAYCDQRDPATYTCLTGIHFDFIVEDGLHEKEAQLTALNTLMPLLEPDGIYIIEDIGYLARSCRLAFAKEIPYPAELVEFHNPKLGSHIAGIIVVKP